MGNRHFHGNERASAALPSLGTAWVRCLLAWIVALAFVAIIAPGSGGKAGAFIVFLLLYPLILVAMAGVVVLGCATLVRAIRGTGAGPGNLMFWLELLPSVIGLGAAASFWTLLKAPW